jgi:proline dehydrogenase
MTILRTTLRTLIDRAARRAARAYIAGPHLSDAISFAQALGRDGMSSTLGYWNEVGEDAAIVHGAYLSAIDAAAAAGLNTYISIKAPAFSMSQPFADALASRCRDRGIGLHFDSLGVERQTETFDMIERLLPIGATLGCTLPARFARSVDDAERAVRHRVRVRVVKGQWDDPAQAIDPRVGYMSIIERLAGRAAHVAVASHDPELVERALTTLAARGTSSELELLLGLPVHRVREIARRLNVPVRMYVPYGYAWLPYAVSAARKNPRILFWILEDAVRGRAPRAGHHT